METKDNNTEWLKQMYLDTLEESRLHTFKRLNIIVYILLTLLFLNVLFTPPDKIINVVFLVIAVLFALFMLWRLTREKAAFEAFPKDVTHLDGEVIRDGIDQIREKQRKLRNQMAIFTIPFLIYFLGDMIVNSTVIVDKYNLTLKLVFFLILIGLYYAVFFKISDINFGNKKTKS